MPTSGPTRTAALALTFSLAAGPAAALELTIGVVNPADDPTTESLMLMKELLDNSATGLSLTVYHSGQLGQEPDLIEQVRIGALDMTTVAASVVSTFSPTVGVLDIPYLLTLENDQVWTVLDGEVGDRLAEDIRRDAGLELLAWWNAGIDAAYARDRIVDEPSDLEGVRIRVIGAPVYIDTFSAFGAQPVSMPLGEIYTSLATGAIDAGESDPSGYRVMKFYEQAPMYSLTSHILLIRPLVMNPDALARMTPEQRAEFADVLARVTEDQRTRIMARVDSDIAFLQGQGVTVTPVDLAPFRAAVQPVVEKYSAALGEDLVDAILEAR
jgi:tripartite ATP-independent transporter DctP family solute receptor